MKKIIYVITIFFVGISFYGCQQELDNWYSETSKYDGRYVVSTAAEEFADGDEEGVELLVYNTASNTPDEVWIDTHVYGEHVKTKIKLTGDHTSFQGTGEAVNTDSPIYYIVNGNLSSSLAAPNASGLTNLALDMYSRVTFKEGKILPNAATTIGGNPSDSIYMKFVLHTDQLTYESYQLPEEDWATPGVPSFAWRVKEGSRIPATIWDDENWTLSGYRYTGYPEDALH